MLNLFEIQSIILFSTGVNLPCDPIWDHRTPDLTGENSQSLVTSHHLTKFGGDTPCRTEDRTFLICHVISSDQVNKTHLIFWVTALHSNSPLLHFFMFIFRMKMEYYVFIYCVKSLYHITKGKCNLMSSTLTLNYHRTKFELARPAKVEKYRCYFVTCHHVTLGSTRHAT